MAEATCTAAGLVTAGTCFTAPLFSPHEQKAVIAYLWWQWGLSTLGVPYVTLETLIPVVECIRAGLSHEKKVAATIGVLNRGVDGLGSLELSGEIISLTSVTAKEAIKCLVQYPDDMLDAIILYSMCGVFGAITS